jgi:hypothetical protein
MHSKVTLADLRDGSHPNAKGHVKMGNLWADAVAANASSSNRTGPRATWESVSFGLKTRAKHNFWLK